MIDALLHTDSGNRNGLVRRTAKMLYPLLQERLDTMLGYNILTGIEEILRLYPALETFWFCLNHTRFDPTLLAMRVILVAIAEIGRLEAIYDKWVARSAAIRGGPDGPKSEVESLMRFRKTYEGREMLTKVMVYL